MNTDQLIDYYFEKKQAGMSFAEIRKQLTEKELDEETVKTIIRLIDKQIVGEELKAAANRIARERIAVGATLTAVGLIATVGSYIGVFNLGNKFILAYGPIVGGLGILGSGLSQKRKGSNLK